MNLCIFMYFPFSGFRKDRATVMAVGSPSSAHQTSKLGSTRGPTGETSWNLPLDLPVFSETACSRRRADMSCDLC